jgi:hypothetical protein
MLDKCSNGEDMALDFQQVYAKIKEIGESVQQRRKTLDERRAKARVLLNVYADALDVLREKVESVKAADPAVRCATPLNEPLDSHLPPPELPLNATLIAADGSQIVPSRHKPVLYYLINVGAIAMEMGSGKAPEIFVETDLHYEEDNENEPPTESQVALRRDLAERKAMLKICKKYSGEILTLTDGQLELWGSTDAENLGEFEKSLQDYLNALRAFREKEIVTAGYIDKPSANWLIRLLEITEISADELQNIRKHHPLHGVTDYWLFSKILGKHERSSVFAFQAKTAEKYKNDISLHFFYINVGDERHPAIARVDIPRWVAQNENKLNTLHQALIEQNRIMSHRPFPYILHRAHEIAVVSSQEHEQVDQMIMLELRKNGGEIGEISGKQSAKDLPGKTRF